MTLVLATIMGTFSFIQGKSVPGHWFVQLDFPNEDGKPYKSSGGEMVRNEKLKRNIPKGWTDRTIVEIENNIDLYG